MSFTEAFSRALVAEASRDDRIVAITAAMPSGTGLDRFAEEYPDRFYDVGIAEEHAVGMAAGLARRRPPPGRRDLLDVHAARLRPDDHGRRAAEPARRVLPRPRRACRRGRADAPRRVRPDLPALDPQHDGARALPTRSSSPRRCTPRSLADGPVAIRYPRGAGAASSCPPSPQPWDAARRADSPEGQRRRAARGRPHGRARAEAAAELLAAQGVSASVVNARWVKPLDLEMVSWAAIAHRLVVTVEENTGMGGFGAACARRSPTMGLDVPDAAPRGAGLLRHARRASQAALRRRADSGGRERRGSRQARAICRRAEARRIARKADDP